MEARKEVVVVGAGPVGLFTALHLKQRGADVMIVEEHEPAATHSFAVVLHPRTVALLANLDLVEPLRWQGQSFRRLLVFADGERRALLDLPVPAEHVEGALTLPQNVLRTTLEHAVAAAGVEIMYGWRLASFEQDADHVHGRFVRAKPASFPTEIRGRVSGLDGLRVVSDFLIGADGYESTVRQLLGSAMLEAGPAVRFAFFDVAQPAPSGENVELVLGAAPAGVYPLHGESTRYAFALDAPCADRPGQGELRYFLDSRLPWHSLSRDYIEWSGVRTFRRAFAERFGHRRVWLAGDACHVTSPLGAQSLNVGLREARDLAYTVSDCLDGRHLEHLVVSYAEQRRLEWQRLLGLATGPIRNRRLPAWASAHFSDLVSALPAAGGDLDDLLDQLDLSLP